MIGLSGSLQAVGFRALTGFLGDLGKSGTLRISHHQWSGEVVYDRGEVVGAAMGAERGLAALDAIALALPEGEFAFVDAPPGSPPEGGREVSLSPPALQARLDELLGQPAARGGHPPHSCHRPLRGAGGRRPGTGRFRPGRWR